MAAAFGTTVGEGARARIWAFFARNPPLWAVTLGLLAPDRLAPHWAVDGSRLIIFALLPLGFWALGVILAADAEDGAFALPPAFDRRVACALALRLVLAPALLYLLALPFIDLPAAYLLLAATPAGLNGLTVSHAYGLDLSLAASAIAWSTGVFLAIALIVVHVT
jgi:predicted permease